MRKTACASARVLFLNSCIHGGGAGRSLVAYFEQRPEGIDPIVVLPAPGVIADQLSHLPNIVHMPEFLERIQTSHNPRINRVPGLNVAYGAATLARAGRKLVKLVQREKPDVIYCNHMLAKPLGVYVGAQTGVPVVLHARNIHDWPVEKQFFQALAKVDCVKTVICNSRASAAPYAEVAEHKVRIVHNFIDLACFDRARVERRLRREFGVASDEMVIGYLGRIIGWKGIDVLIRAFAQLAAAHPKVVVAIVGGNDGGLKTDLRARYEALAASLGVGERVIFTGFRDDVVPYLADFDVLAVPSVRPEPFGRVIIEAMALGIPPVITSQGGAVEIVTHERNGLWAQPRSTGALAAALERLVADASLRKSLGEQAAIEVRARFDGKVLAQELTRLLHEAAGYDA